MLTDTPGLVFIAAHHLADKQIIGTVVPAVRGLTRQGARLHQDHFMCTNQFGKLCDRGLSSARSAAYPRFLHHILGQGECDPTQCLDAFRDRIRELVLFAVVLIKEQMQLIKRSARGLPVIFSIEIAES